METHEVFNQSPIFENINLFEIDKPLQLILQQGGVDWGLSEVKDYGKTMGTRQMIDNGRLANKYTPVFETHNARGFRTDEVEFHPAYHELMTQGIKHGVHALPWSERKPGSHLLRMAMFYLHAQNEAGTCCPITMTFSCIPALQKHFPKADEWIPKILARTYDPSNQPYFEKQGLTIGMAMTEKQGGSDVRANTTEAKPVGKAGTGELYGLTGHKWFCSAPMSDGFLTLAQTAQGISCFLLPRWLPDGSKNKFRIQRLKDKLGNRSNASSEIEFDGAQAWLMGEEGRGVSVILEMVALTRYDCMIGSSALMRRGLTEVLHHIRHRKAFGKLLVDQPLMQNVVADLCLESEAALAMTYRTALCLENGTKEEEKLLLRLLTPVGKYWITKRSIPFLGEAMECLGGNGYVESSVLPRLYREAPVNAIWEGSGNVQCLDVMRAISKSPAVLDALIHELESNKGNLPVYDRFIEKLSSSPNQPSEGQSRYFVEQLAKAVQASALMKMGREQMAEAYCLSRLTEGSSGWMFGNLPPAIDSKVIVEEYVF
ncbi:acyl-CoA dehydrogenase family protein [Fulvivirga kasyanovii]|uniref:Isovaleryl-CoA dehydrogenase n=1 Tax=Fulvivirga kasyanovii TaxID=396812 RepID=A0ABW9RKK4_9BACT|nr:isovaleryl-CoA dehydrogenase [Fulvivirga kasyanovii]MTI23899.1 isovaleryl-CoA dehydrogenase [Fulvivirga kasyanovii]